MRSINEECTDKRQKTSSMKEEEIVCFRNHPLTQALVKYNQDNATNGPPLLKLSSLMNEIEKQLPPSKDLNKYLRILVIAEMVGVRGHTSTESRFISDLKDNKCLRIIEVKLIKPHTMYEMNRKECGGSYNDNGSSMQHVVIDKLECYIDPVGNKVMNYCIIPALKDHPLKPLCTQNDGNTLVNGGSLLISTFGNVQMGAGISEQLGDADKVKWRKGQYKAIYSFSVDTTPKETRTALCEMEKNVFDTAKANNPINGREMRSKEGMVVPHQLIEIDNEYNRQEDEIHCKFSST